MKVTDKRIEFVIVNDLGLSTLLMNHETIREALDQGIEIWSCDKEEKEISYWTDRNIALTYLMRAVGYEKAKVVNITEDLRNIIND